MDGQQGVHIIRPRDIDVRMREERQAACVIQVQMREDDAANLFRPHADKRQLCLQPLLGRLVQGEFPLHGFGPIALHGLGVAARIIENQAVRMLDEKGQHRHGQQAFIRLPAGVVHDAVFFAIQISRIQHIKLHNLFLSRAPAKQASHFSFCTKKRRREELL